MAGFTNKGKHTIFETYFNSVAAPTNLYMALVTTTPDADDNTLSDLTQMTTGNGYVDGGLIMTRNTTDFPSISEDDANDRVQIAVKDMVWTASGGNFLNGGSTPTYAVITDDNATVANREVLFYFALTGAADVSDGQTFTVTGGLLQGNES